MESSDFEDPGIFDEEPTSDEKTWVRHRLTGDLGWLVKENGVTKVHLDRLIVNLKDYRPSEWKIDHQKRPMTRYQLAQVAFEADKMLCRSLGIQQSTQRWETMSWEDRGRWRDQGPAARGGKPSPRQTLWSAIMEGMKEFVG